MLVPQILAIIFFLASVISYYPSYAQGLITMLDLIVSVLGPFFVMFLPPIYFWVIEPYKIRKQQQSEGEDWLEEN